MGSILLAGGEVFDPTTGSFQRRDVAVSGGRIVASLDEVVADEVIDVTGLVVSPGLVDLHTHIFRGQDLGLAADEIGRRSGTTTFVDAGSAGGHLFDAFRRTTIEPSAVRIRAFVNIASIGTTSIMLGGELKALYYSDEKVAEECIDRHRDVILGVKVRASGDVGGDNSPIALERARSVADNVGLPLMVHLGPSPAGVDEIVGLLRRGDILTHSFSGWEGNKIVSAGSLRPAVRAARERGVILDIGHGMSGFSAAVARTMIDGGELPDTISTDLHTYSAPSVVDFPTVLSKFLALGMTLEQVLTAATLTPARVIGLDGEGVGTLSVGAAADVAVFRRLPGSVEFHDGFGGSFAGTERITPVLTVLGGRVVWDELRTAEARP